jgi:hypothetical protein
MQEILIYRSLLSNGESTGVFLLYINQKMITICASGIDVTFWRHSHASGLTVLSSPYPLLCTAWSLPSV